VEIQPFALTQDGAAVNMQLVRYVTVRKTAGPFVDVTKGGRRHPDVYLLEAHFDDDSVIELVRARNEDEAQKCLDHIFVNGGVVNYRDGHPAAAWGSQPKK
jgi:hypothetical protein